MLYVGTEHRIKVGLGLKHFVHEVYYITLFWSPEFDSRQRMDFLS